MENHRNGLPPNDYQLNMSKPNLLAMPSRGDDALTYREVDDSSRYRVNKIVENNLNFFNDEGEINEDGEIPANTYRPIGTIEDSNAKETKQYLENGTPQGFAVGVSQNSSIHHEPIDQK